MNNEPRNWSDTGQSFNGALAVAPTRVTKRQLVLNALRSGPITTSEANSLGGSEGTRRIRELRQQGHNITTAWQEDSSQFLYTLHSEAVK